MPWPIPEDIWPIPPGRVLERPWWSRTEKVTCFLFGQDRSPGQVHVTSGPEDPRFFYEHVRSDGARLRFDPDRVQKGTSRLEQLAEYDRAHPIPQPPCRAGQVWATVRGDTILIVGATRQGMARLPDVAFCAEARYLLYDPVQPSAAPWAPPESA